MRRWLIVRWRVVAARVDDPLALGTGLLVVGLVAGLGAGARLVPSAPVQAAVGFVAVWARPREGWHAAVWALATPELGAALDATDPRSLLDAVPTGQRRATRCG